ncbi:MAG: hypothetical protein NZR01_10450 [Bryobacteraceae bacterium]|nr:hypothetical protein [Bryobacteraceae bacterium]
MRRVAWIMAAAALAPLVFISRGAPPKPVYVGSRVCATCHNGPGMGHQYSRWLLSKHAQAYAALSRPESWEIARISGLREEPWKAAICLGCHSTAFGADEREMDPETFRREDGLQCEACHGPGSEYATEAVMRDRKAAMAAGLRMPTRDDCLVCHLEKGSHIAVLKNPTVNIDEAWKQIAHPLPKPSRVGAIREADAPGVIGSAACGSCHNGLDHGHQYDVWRRSPHARAWAVLATPRAAELAREMKVEGDPQHSPACLRCHAVGGRTEEGVGCEACHGPGKNYATDAIMRDPEAARAAGLKRGSLADCMSCHNPAHGRTFNAAEAWKLIAHPTKLPERKAEVRYKNPLRLAFRPGTGELWATLAAADAVAVVDTRTRRVLAEIRTGGEPTGIAFTSDGRRAFVTNREDDTVTVIDAAARKVVDTLRVGDEPHGVIVTPGDEHVLVLNTSSEDIHVFHARTLAFEKKLAAGRGPWEAALAPDGATIFVTSMYSNLTGFRKPLASELTVIDARTARVRDRWLIDGTNLMMGIDWRRDGRFAIATMNRTKNLVPMTRLLQGWTITNGIAIIWPDGRTDQVLLDQPGLGFADATDVRITPDNRYALVTSSGTNRIAVVDLARLERLLTGASDHERQHVLPNHLGKAAEFLVKTLETADSPRGLAISPDGRRAYVANCLDDSIGVIDLATLEMAGKISLNGPKEITRQRWGEKLFHNAKITFRYQYSCHSCHPDGHVDGITYDIEPDGIGVSPVDNRTLRGIGDTAPFKWEGTNPSLKRQCGARLSVFFTRNLPFTPEELDAVDYYISTIRRPPNRYYTPGTRYTPAQRRGKDLFYRTHTNDGRLIPPEGRCYFCHPAPYYTNRRRFDVGTRQALDRTGLFDVPHLNNIYDSAPYLHNGMAKTLEEIWTVYNPYDKHGVTNDMTKDQLNDLIEFLKTL